MPRIWLMVTVEMTDEQADAWRETRGTPQDVTLTEDLRSFVEASVDRGLAQVTDATATVTGAW